MSDEKASILWTSAGATLRAYEPSAAQVAVHAAALAQAYNEPYNRSMMGHAEMSAEDVCAHFAASAAAGGRLFLLERDAALMGDADFRNLEGTDAEFAIMIGGRQAQGRGLGTRFAVMLHAWAFRALGLERIYITVLAQNVASKRMFEKLGYRIDGSPELRAHVDNESDVAMSIARGEFERLHASALAELAAP
jgi:RimJ/RimL family protein N-acetyltransferase